MRPVVRDYAELITEIAGERIRSLTLFGDIASGTFDAKRQPVRSVFVLDSFELSILRRLAECGGRLSRKGVAAPLVMTPAYIDRSRDTFPLEFIEIKQQHVTVLGADLFEPLTFKDADVRLQCEREIKTILLGLRQAVLESGGRESELEWLEQGACDALLRTFRGVLWLKGKREAMPALKIVAEVETLTGKPLTGIREALDPAEEDTWAQFERLYTNVETLGAVIDAL